MLRQYSGRRVLFLLLLDWVGTLATLALAAQVRSTSGPLPHEWVTMLRSLGMNPDSAAETGPLSGIVSPAVFALVAVLWPLSMGAFSVYDGRGSASLGDELSRVFSAISTATLILAGLLFLGYRETSRAMVVLFFLLDALFLLSSRVLLHTALTRWGRPGARGRNVIIVGAGRVGRNAAQALAQYARANIQLVGFVDDDPSKLGQAYNGLPVIGRLDQLPSLVARYGIAEAIVALPLGAHEKLVGTVEALQHEGVHLHVIPDLFALSFPNATLDGFGGIPMIDLGQPRTAGLGRAMKRGFDLAVAGIGLAAMSPILLAVAVAVKLDSSGPVLYRQQRVGENGRLFHMLKFRSMQVDADPSVHQQHVSQLIRLNVDPTTEDGNGSLKIVGDKRVTPVGRLIRRASLDELPQLFNVIRGEMSLVGPRPAIPYELDSYKDWHRKRLFAVPGITGLWQVRGRNRVSFDEMVRMDLEYINKQSLWLDIRILLETPYAVISGRGAG